MKIIDDSPPAFPSSQGIQGSWEGMSLREYYAAKAMQGLLSNPNDIAAHRPKEETLVQAFARHAFAYADAMIEAGKASS